MQVVNYSKPNTYYPVSSPPTVEPNKNHKVDDDGVGVDEKFVDTKRIFGWILMPAAILICMAVAAHSHPRPLQQPGRLNHLLRRPQF